MSKYLLVLTVLASLWNVISCQKDSTRDWTSESGLKSLVPVFCSHYCLFSASPLHDRIHGEVHWMRHICCERPPWGYVTVHLSGSQGLDNHYKLAKELTCVERPSGQQRQKGRAGLTQTAWRNKRRMWMENSLNVPPLHPDPAHTPLIFVSRWNHGRYLHLLTHLWSRIRLRGTQRWVIRWEKQVTAPARIQRIRSPVLLTKGEVLLLLHLWKRRTTQHVKIWAADTPRAPCTHTCFPQQMTSRQSRRMHNQDTQRRLWGICAEQLRRPKHVEKSSSRGNLFS